MDQGHSQQHWLSQSDADKITYGSTMSCTAADVIATAAPVANVDYCGQLQPNGPLSVMYGQVVGQHLPNLPDYEYTPADKHFELFPFYENVIHVFIIFFFFYWSHLVCGTGFPDCLAGEETGNLGVGEHEILQIYILSPKCLESLRV